MFYEAIKIIYPTILDSQFILQDDGEGPYIKAWNFDQPQPTEAEITAAMLPALKANMTPRIDSDVDAIYAAAIGNRGPEYVDAETAANAYKAAGYAGNVPPEVQSWVTAKGWTAQQAADDILAAAAQLNNAKLAIRAQRLLRKEQIRTAADVAAIDAVMVEWDGFVAQVKAQLGL